MDGTVTKVRTAREGIVVRAMLLLLLFVSCAVPAYAAGIDEAVFEGRVLDTKGRPVEGAMVFLYAGEDVRRSPDFISNRTDASGAFRVVLPGKRSYWAVARLKKSEGYGPLMRGDKHSGDPVEVDFDSGGTVRMDFTVADLEEAIRTSMKERERARKITGKILDGTGKPVKGVYAIASRTPQLVGIPDYLSAWTDEQGNYTLFLPKGKYTIGAASAFPPGRSWFLQGPITVDADRSGVDIIWKGRENK